MVLNWTNQFLSDSYLRLDLRASDLYTAPDFR